MVKSDPAFGRAEHLHLLHPPSSQKVKGLLSELGFRGDALMGVWEVLNA
jgi:hypothetical protein